MSRRQAAPARRVRDQARLDIVNWIEGWYNHDRLHGSIGRQTPAGFEQELFAA